MVSHLINEVYKAVVETFDLIFLVGADSLDGGVYVYPEWGQQALVDGHWGDGGAQVGRTAELGDGIGPQGPAAEAP